VDKALLFSIKILESTATRNYGFKEKAKKDRLKTYIKSALIHP